MHRAKVIAFRSDQPATWQELLEEFLTFKRAQGRAPRTLQDYDGTVKTLLQAVVSPLLEHPQPQDAPHGLPHEVEMPDHLQHSPRLSQVLLLLAGQEIASANPLSDFTAKAIKKLLKTLPSKWNGESPVFANWEGNVMRVETWAQRVKELYAAKLGVSLRPYDLRHCFALNFLRDGGNVFDLQRIMGHAHLDMTRRYLALTQGDIQGEHS